MGKNKKGKQKEEIQRAPEVIHDVIQEVPEPPEDRGIGHGNYDASAWQTEGTSGDPYHGDDGTFAENDAFHGEGAGDRGWEGDADAVGDDYNEEDEDLYGSPRQGSTSLNDGWAGGGSQEEWGGQPTEAKASPKVGGGSKGAAWRTSSDWTLPQTGWTSTSGRHPISSQWPQPAAPPAPAPAPAAPTHKPAWMSWGHDARSMPKPPPLPPAPMTTHNTAGGSKNVLSPQQRSHILNSLLSQPTQSYGTYVPGHEPTQHQGGWHQSDNPKTDHHHHREGKGGKNHKKQQHFPPQAQRQHSQQSQQSWDGWGGGGGNDRWAGDGGSTSGGWGNDGWGGEADNGWANKDDGWGNNDDGWGDEEEEEDYGREYNNRKAAAPRPQKASPKAPPLGMTMGASYTMPSKTLAHAYRGTTNPTMLTGLSRNGMQDYADIRFIESKGAALEAVRLALYSKARSAKDRIHWAFPPDKDERVSSLLSWIQAVSYGLGGYGLHKFLQSRERGALVTNADYHSPKSPTEPAFDWLTFDQLRPTRDRIMQTSVATYDPAVTVIVFVLLPSKSGQSMAIWRRKIAVPNNLRLAYVAEITQAMRALRREEDYVCYVDELPGKEPEPVAPPPPPPKPKRKWWKLGIRW